MTPNTVSRKAAIKSKRGPVRPDDVTALILGAGDGTRVGQSKALLKARGETLLERAVAATLPFASEIIVGVRSADAEESNSLVGARATIMAGGATRHETIETLFASATRPIILLHEVARPMVAEQQFEQVIEAAAEYGAACPCILASSRDSLAIMDDDFVQQGLSRDNVVCTQIPQAYRHEVLADTLQAARANGWKASSVVALCVQAGHRVRAITGDPENIKVTFAEDWEAFRAWQDR